MQEQAIPPAVKTLIQALQTILSPKQEKTEKYDSTIYLLTDVRKYELTRVDKSSFRMRSIALDKDFENEFFLENTTTDEEPPNKKDEVLFNYLPPIDFLVGCLTQNSIKSIRTIVLLDQGKAVCFGRYKNDAGWVLDKEK